jgi:hypothetical protein
MHKAVFLTEKKMGMEVKTKMKSPYSETKLKVAKQIIKDNLIYGRYGLFNSRNTVGDRMVVLFKNAYIEIDICYEYEYFEIFGLTDNEFNELLHFYNSIVNAFL